MTKYVIVEASSSDGKGNLMDGTFTFDKTLPAGTQVEVRYTVVRLPKTRKTAQWKQERKGFRK